MMTNIMIVIPMWLLMLMIIAFMVGHFYQDLKDRRRQKALRKEFKVPEYDYSEFGADFNRRAKRLYKRWTPEDSKAIESDWKAVLGDWDKIPDDNGEHDGKTN